MNRDYETTGMAPKQDTQRSAPPAGGALGDSDPVVALAYAALRSQVPGLSRPRRSRGRFLSDGEVHGMRVATRRARSALHVFRDVLPDEIYTAFNGELKWLAGMLGKVRDLDVHREQHAACRSKLPKRDAKALRAYEHDLRVEWEKASAALQEALQSDRYGSLTSGLAEAVKEGAELVAAGGSGVTTIRSAGSTYIGVSARRVLKRGRSVGDSATSGQLHELRKEGKKFRYLLEFFAPFFGEPLADAHQAAHRLQDVLGAHQDAVAAVERLRTYVERVPPGRTSRAEMLAVGQLIGIRHRAAADARKRFARRWREFETAVADLPGLDRP